MMTSQAGRTAYPDTLPPMRPPVATLLLLALAAAACVVPGSPGVEAGSGPGSDLIPTFAPISPSASPAQVDPTPETVTPTDEGGPSIEGDERTGPVERPTAERRTDETEPDAASPADEGASPPRILRAEVDDAAGDVTFSAEPPPEHADLLGTEVVREADGFAVRHELKGGAPPDTDDEHTMNIATFFDVDGDGEVDHHVWANLSSSGWGSAYFDERSGTARYADEDDVDVHVDDEGRVLVRFPHGHLSDARSFRWSVGSEWGRYEVIGTDTAARDSAPEDHGSVSFPQ